MFVRAYLTDVYTTNWLLSSADFLRRAQELGRGRTCYPAVFPDGEGTVVLFEFLSPDPGHSGGGMPVTWLAVP